MLELRRSRILGFGRLKGLMIYHCNCPVLGSKACKLAALIAVCEAMTEIREHVTKHGKFSVLSSLTQAYHAQNPTLRRDPMRSSTAETSTASPINSFPSSSSALTKSRPLISATSPVCFRPAKKILFYIPNCIFDCTKGSDSTRRAH
jgi:hypothetical protein